IQEEISFLGVLANILSSPVVPILTITGMISAVCIPIFPALQLLTLPVIELCSAWILLVARSVADLEIFIATPFSVFLFNVFVLLVLLILAKIFSFQKEKVQFPRRKFPSLFFSALEDGGGKGAGKFFQYFRKLFQSRKYGMLGGYFLLGICATTSVIFSSGIIGAKLTGVSQGINWQIVQCDVGQGSALIVKEKDLVVLIDAGPPNSKAVQCLKNNDINKLDLLVLTHLDLDHVGGVAEILQQVLVREIWVGPNIAPIERFEYLQRVTQEKQVALRNVSAGAVYEDFLEVLSPKDRELMEDPELTNERSLVVQLQQENLRTLVLADVPLEVQNNLDPGEQDVVIVAHHGAADQSELLAAKTRPRLALISVGENDYGHPHPKALQIWGGIDSLDKGRDSAKTEQVMLGTKILTTKDCGEIKVSAQGFSGQCNDSQ
ncbi:MAG: MBL fold metallo-hydrolase, partial [Arcanobacterium sp.]|nr:MBL fold metallo-hydrolase [Arcanobacterium sp.]